MVKKPIETVFYRKLVSKGGGSMMITLPKRFFFAAGFDRHTTVKLTMEGKKIIVEEP